VLACPLMMLFMHGGHGGHSGHAGHGAAAEDRTDTGQASDSHHDSAGRR
jgi:hypothetical protein